MKSASFIIAALMAAVSASKGDTTPVAGADAPKEPNNLWVHPDGTHKGSVVMFSNNWGNVVFMLDNDAAWNTPGGVDLQKIIVDKLAKRETVWSEDTDLNYDCRGDWGDSYIEVAGTDKKWCQGQTMNKPPLSGKFKVKAPIPPPPPYHGTNTGKPFYNDIREQELKCLADRNSEWHYDAATNTGTCTKNNLKPYKPYEPEHDIRAQKQAGVVQKALKK